MIVHEKIKLIIWDLDETLWNGTLSDNDTIELKKEFIDFINESLDRGIVHSICSKNDFDATKNYMEQAALWDLFVFPSISWDPKGARIKNIIADMKLRPENVLFVDDNTSNLHEAAYYCPALQICTPHELEDAMGAICKINAVDASRPRLTQYRLLEQKNKIKNEFASNEEFLMSCNIRVEFHNDCKENIDRIHELILRSNQLNYTKYRQDKAGLIADLSLPDTQAAYITVTDNFGDYGIVGFYMIVNGSVKHYLFSCRTLGMLVEQYVYTRIGCPEINVVGEVITKLNKTDAPKWINQQNAGHDEKQRKYDVGNLKILFKGPCDISQIFSFIEETDGITTEFTYTNDNGISVEGYNHTSQLVTALRAGADKAKLIHDTPWLDEKMLDASSWQENDAIIFSLLSDGNLGIYQHNETGWQISLCEKYYDLTDPKNWEAYINKDIFTSQITFTKEALSDFSRKYKFINNDHGEVTIENLDCLYNAKRPETKLILLLGSEKAFTGQAKPSYENRHIFHKLLNDKVKIWAAGKHDVHLIEIGKYIASQKDYLDTINHFQKNVYYRMAQDILSILGDAYCDVKIKSKLYLYWSILRKKISLLMKKLRKQAKHI